MLDNPPRDRASAEECRTGAIIFTAKAQRCKEQTYLIRSLRLRVFAVSFR
jgi:hypothetical protein